MGWRENIARTLGYEDEGRLAAQKGLTREDCPYPDESSAAHNFWIYGNENEQSRMLDAFMKAEGIEPFLMSTGPQTKEQLDALAEWHEKAKDARKRMREAKGWKP